MGSQGLRTKVGWGAQESVCTDTSSIIKKAEKKTSRGSRDSPGGPQNCGCSYTYILEHSACLLFSVIAREIVASCFKTALSWHVWNQYCNTFRCVQLTLKPIWDLLVGACVILIIGRLQRPFHTQVQFYIFRGTCAAAAASPLSTGRAPMLVQHHQCRCSSLPAVPGLKAPQGWALLTAAVPTAGAAEGLGTEEQRSLRAGRAVPWHCCFQDSRGVLCDRGSLDVSVAVWRISQCYCRITFCLCVSFVFFLYAGKKKPSCNQDDEVNCSGLQLNTWQNSEPVVLQLACLAAFRNINCRAIDFL